MQARRLGWFLFFSLVAVTPGRVRADERFVFSLEASAALPVADVTASRFGLGAAGAGTFGITFDDVVATGLRLEGGFLSDGPPPGNHLVDPGIGTWEMATLELRIRPFGDLFHEGRRSTGLLLEVGAGIAITRDLVRPGLTGSIGWGFAAGDVVLVPTIGIQHVVSWEDPLGGVGALVGRVGLALVLGDTTPPAVTTDTPPGDRDSDGLLDDDDFCPDEPEDADDFEDQDGCPDPDDDRDGVLDGRDACRLIPEDLDGDQDDDGCPEDATVADRDHDGFLDQDDTCPDEAEVVNGVTDHDGCPDEGLFVLTGDRVVLDDRVLFEFAQARVRHAARPMLASVVAMFHDHPDWDRVRIEGHTDQRGDDAFNLALSERRAAAVQAALIAMGLSADRIEVVAYGESQPCDHGDTEEAHARNRRVELVMIDDPSGPVAPPEPIGETTLARAEGGSR